MLLWFADNLVSLATVCALVYENFSKPEQNIKTLYDKQSLFVVTAIATLLYMC